MRKNCRWTFDAWRAGRSLKPAESIWTDGTTVYSYRTAIAVTLPSGVILNRTPYSVTTTTQLRQSGSSRHATCSAARASAQCAQVP
jgi:hypothetical protein